MFSSLARYHTFQGPEAEAVRLGRQALEIAEDLGLEDIRAHALNYIGTARVSSGDLAGLNDLERSIDIARAINTPFSLLAYNNLAGTLDALGQPRGPAGVRRGAAEAKRFGIASHVEDFEHALYDGLWISGRWDEFLPHLDAAIELGGGSMEAMAAFFAPRYSSARRATMRRQGALEDATTALQLARSRSALPQPGPSLRFGELRPGILSVGEADRSTNDAGSSRVFLRLLPRNSRGSCG